MKRTTTKRTTEQLANLHWKAHFHTTINNPNAPDGKVDMYLLVDDETGEGLVSVGVPYGRKDIAEYIAGCCGKPRS